MRFYLFLSIVLFLTPNFSVVRAEKRGERATPTEGSSQKKGGTTDSEGQKADTEMPSSPKKSTHPPLPKGKKRGARVFILWRKTAIEPPNDTEGKLLAQMLERLASSKLDSVKNVKFKRESDFSSLPPELQTGSLEKFDKVQLVNLHSTTGFDGVVISKYQALSRGKFQLTLILIDLKRGKIFRSNRLKGPVRAELFQKIETLLLSFASELRKAYLAVVSVNSSPKGADLYLNGKLAGKTPITLELQPGTYLLKLAKEGFEPAIRKFELHPGERVTIDRRLKSTKASLYVESDPPGSSVLIDGKFQGKTPFRGELKAGKHKLVVKRNGYKPYAVDLTVKGGEEVKISARLLNSLAARFLNAPPGIRVDSRQVHLSYRYVFLGLDRPYMLDSSFMDLAFLLRFSRLETGLRFSFSSPIDTTTKFDTFAGKGMGIQNYSINLFQIGAVGRFAIFDKFSFASLFVGGSLGATLTRVKSDYESELLRWSFSADAGLSLVSRLFRINNVSLELQFELGFSYLGQLRYTERKYTLFGEAGSEVKEKPLLGGFGALRLRLVFWNEIF